MAELTIELVREWLAGNKATEAVKAFLKELGATEPKLTADIVGEWLKTDEGKKVTEPMVDRRVTEAIRTHDVKTKDSVDIEVKRRVAEELLKMNPQETPEQKQIRELREQMDHDRKEAARDKLQRAIVEEAARQKIPSWWVDEYAGSTIEEAKLFLGKVKKHIEEIATQAKNELLVTGFKPGSGNGQPAQTPTAKDLKGKSREELIKMEMEGTLDKALKGA